MAHMPLSETTTRGQSAKLPALFPSWFRSLQEQTSNTTNTILRWPERLKPRLLLVKGIIPPHPIPRELIQLQPAPGGPNLRDHHTHSHFCHCRRRNRPLVSCHYLPTSLCSSLPVSYCGMARQREETLTSYSSACKGEGICNLPCSHIADKDMAIFHIPFTRPGSVLTLRVGRSHSFRNKTLSMSSYSSISLHICIPIHPLPLPIGKMARAANSCRTNTIPGPARARAFG